MIHVKQPKEEQPHKKCKMCKGTGQVQPKGATIAGKCYYCRGKGYRTSKLGRDEP